MAELYQRAKREVAEHGMILTKTSLELQACFVDVAALERYLLDKVEG